jgi:threonine synthase
MNGVTRQVTDDEIMEARAMVARWGFGCEPASAASVAGTRRLVAEGTIRPGERVVAVLTGHLLKDAGALLGSLPRAEQGDAHENRPVEIEPELSEIARHLGT